MRIDLALNDEQIRYLASQSGMMRDDPKKSWTMPEYKHHARQTVKHLIEGCLPDRLLPILGEN